MGRIVLTLLAATTLLAHAQEGVPGSTSPDKKVYLWFRAASSSPGPSHNEFFFRDTTTLALLSAQLEPDVPHSLSSSSAMEADDENILFDHIGARVEADRGHGQSDPAFSYFVAWSPNSNWVSIEGGAHKFWKALVYHRIADRFEPVALPDGINFEKYFQAHDQHLVLQRSGAKAATRKISARTYDFPQVCWLENGLLAINAYPHLLRDADYEVRNDHDLFFLLDATKSPATLTGFCR